jgi:PhzF family phenazine biosynthesis protein
MTSVLEYTAFSQHPAGGNPAGVVLDATGLDVETMQELAAGTGVSETAFLFPVGDDDFVVRYFSPRSEVSFCAHATIAAAVAYAERRGPGGMTLYTRSGRVQVATRDAGCGGLSATVTSVPTRVVKLAGGDLAMILEALGWTASDLDPTLPPWVAYAGAWHPIIAAKDRDRLADLHPDDSGLRALMSCRGWSTVNLLWRASERSFHCRNAFSPGGAVEAAATGAAAAALGGYLRALSVLPLPATVSVFQGEELGRPSQLSVHVPAHFRSGVSVTGHAVALPTSRTGWRSPAEQLIAAGG